MAFVVLIAVLIIVSAVLALRYLSAGQFQERREDEIHDIANTYFRLGQQAMLLAKDRQEGIRAQLLAKYPDRNFGTNEADFKLATSYLDVIDDPRVFQALRDLNDGKTWGLDTNNWEPVFTGTNHHIGHPWTLLMK